MRLVVQRVMSAKVTDIEKGTVIGEIERGLFVLLGVADGDNKESADFLAEKLVKLRVMSDENDKMNLSVIDEKASLLIVSQFTLYADTSKGNRPSFVKAAQPERAKKLYEYFVGKVNERGVKVQTGKFGAYMKIDADLDGPVTIVLEK